jgi:phosphonate ABC transporter permease subunit PhnE
MVSNAIGGLENAPIQIAFTGLVLLLVFGYFGSKLGGELFDWLKSNVSPLLSRALTGLGAGAMAAGAGYFLGTWFNRGVVTIPLGEEAAALTESSYALGFAVVLGVLAATYAFLRAHFDFSVGMVVYSIARTLMNIVRSIEPLIWAIIATIWIGLGPFAGTIALTLHTIAALGKLYSESIESIDPGPIEALQATGANRLQTIVYAVVPQILPPYISFTIYRWDINVRMSTIIGAVGGGGIGFILIQWIRQFQYDAAGLAVWLITITVATLDYVSSNIRERFV